MSFHGILTESWPLKRRFDKTISTQGPLTCLSRSIRLLSKLHLLVKTVRSVWSRCWDCFVKQSLLVFTADFSKTYQWSLVTTVFQNNANIKRHKKSCKMFLCPVCSICATLVAWLRTGKEVCYGKTWGWLVKYWGYCLYAGLWWEGKSSPLLGCRRDAHQHPNLTPLYLGDRTSEVWGAEWVNMDNSKAELESLAIHHGITLTHQRQVQLLIVSNSNVR